MSKTPKLRFKEFSGKWESKKLGDECTFFSGGTPLTTNRRYYDGNIPFIRSAEISGNITELKISEEGLNNSSAKMVQKGDLLYALYGATSGEVSICNIDGAINQAILCIKSDKLSLSFLEKILRKNKENIITFGIENKSDVMAKNAILSEDGSVYDTVVDGENYSPKLESLIHKTIKKVQTDLTTMAYNTAVSSLMILANAYDAQEEITPMDYNLLLTLLNPMAPHITEELNEQIGFKPICESEWPVYDEAKTVDEEKEIGVQVNGKLRATIKVNINDAEDTLKEKALSEENVKKFTEGKEIVKVIAIKGKIVNIVVK